MCLIAYVPAGKSLPIENMKAAHFANDDGIGIMSSKGIWKFLGRKALKKAIKTVATLEAEKIEYAIHFRYKTHGDVILQNCHPFETPNKRAYVMHNGVLGQYTAKATKDCSDTGAFVREYLTEVPEDNNMDYWSEVARHIGWGNKLCIMTYDFKFILVHGEAGTYRDGIWYSQTYSLPHIPVVYAGSYSGGRYIDAPWTTRRPPIERSNVWPYHVLDCNCHTCSNERLRRASEDNTTVGLSSDSWYRKAKEREDRAAERERERVPHSVVSDSLRRALDRRYGDGIPDPRLNGGHRIASKPLQLTHNPGMTRTAIQALAADTLGSTCDVPTPSETQRKDEDNQLDAALREHLMRIDDDGGYAEVELEVSTRGDCQLPGWSETGTDS
jgi:hypothetical protein